MTKCDFPPLIAALRRSQATDAAEKHLSEQIGALLEHYKQMDPLGIPGAPIPDPFQIPNTKQNMLGQTLELTNSSAYGISKFRLKNIRLNVEAMTVCPSWALDQHFPLNIFWNFLKVEAAVELDLIALKGNYTLKQLFGGSVRGPFTIVVKSILALGNASVAVNRDGQIRTEDIDIDIKIESLKADFKNMGKVLCTIIIQIEQKRLMHLL